MGRLLLFAFFVTLVVIVFYLFSSAVYFVLALKGALGPYSHQIELPFEDWLVSYRRTTPKAFVLVGPLYALAVVISLYVYGKLQPSPANPRRDPFDQEISVALTAYDDDESIADAVQDFMHESQVAEVIVVDNNSSDSTADSARKAGARVVGEEKQGYGYACIRGFKEALEGEETNVVVLAEGDGTFRGHDIQKMLPYLDHVDLVIGTRTTQELVSKDCQMDWFLVWGNFFLAKLIELKYWNIRFRSTVRLTDVGCTMRAIRKDALERILPQLRIGGMHFSPHMIMVALSNKLRVIEVPITFWERVGKSKGAGGNRLRAIGIGLQMLWEIIKY